MKTFTYRDKTITVTPLPFIEVYRVTDGDNINYTCHVGMYNNADTEQAQQYYYNLLNR